MDLFLKMCVIQAFFCWLGDSEKIICPWKQSVVDNSGCLKGVDVENVLFVSPPPPTEGVTLTLRSHPVSQQPPLLHH